MKNIGKKLGFTLIELLVVITIIGILATGAVSVFTTQLQWARDSTRISDIKTMETALHQLFSDNSEYPTAWTSANYPNWFTWAIKPFISKSLRDPKSWKSICWADSKSDHACQWTYWTQDDTFWLTNARFRLAVYFEKETNYKQKAWKWKDWDGWTDDNTYEIYAGAGGSGTTSNTVIY